MKKPYKIFTGCAIAVLALLAFKNPPQESLLLKNIVSKLMAYNLNEAPEKTYLHTDKEFYTNGETIWFKTYLVDGITHTQSSKSKVVYVELVDAWDSIVERRKLYANALGAYSDIALGKDIPEGTYKLRSYTKYMLNEEEPVYYQKTIPVVVQNVRTDGGIEERNTVTVDVGNSNENFKEFAKPKLRFFPEGGNLVQGIGTTLGLEVTDGYGKGIKLKGEIKDDRGNAITPFESFDFGLGKVNFKPMPGKTYYASITTENGEERFALPNVAPVGYGVGITDRGDHLLLQVQSTTEDGVLGTVLVGHLRGKMVFNRIGAYENQNNYAVKLYKKDLADGVAQFTLFSPDGKPVCERLIFVDNPENDVTLDISSNNETYGYREKVSLDMALTDANGSPLKGDFSMGVVTASNRLGTGPASTDLRSWLLLDSDLGGTVPDAGFFFEEDTKEKKYLLDALMLTHGWRRFVWTDMLSKNVNKKPAYVPEKGIMISGRTTNFYNRTAPKKTRTSLNILGGGIMQADTLTNAQGEFAFGPFFFTDSIVGVVQAVDSLRKSKSKQRSIAIALDAPWPSVTPRATAPQGRETIVYPTNYFQESYRKKVSDFKYDPDVTQLKEVVVTEKKKISMDQIVNEATGAFRGIFTNRVYSDSIPGSQTMSAFDLLRRLPGVVVLGTYPRQGAKIVGRLGAGPVLYLIDGFPTSIDNVQTMRANEIWFVDVLKGPDATMYGSRGAGGAISFYTDRGFILPNAEPEIVPGIINFEIPGFYRTKEFYTPNYAIAKKEHERPDYRTTLFWKPNLRMNDFGLSTVDFYTGDGAGSYMVKIEGMTYDGRPVSGMHTINVTGSD